MFDVNNSNADGTENQALIDLAGKFPQPLPGDPPGLVAMGGAIHDYRAMLPATDVQATRHTHTAEAFAELVKHLKEPTTTVFADQKNLRVCAVIDFSEGGSPSRDEHQVRFEPELHPDWRAWALISGTVLDQVDFAEFVEERIDTIVSPAGADLLELVQDLRGHRNVEFQSSRRLADGQTQLQYVEKLETKGAPGNGLVTVPSDLTIQTPVFRGGDPQTLSAFLRFRISSVGALTFTVKLKRQDDIVPDAFAFLTEDIEGWLNLDGDSGVKVYAGWYL